MNYYFPVQDGEYLVELYFAEPWLGTGGGMDCGGWRLFDVAINDKTVLRNLDIWKEAGHDGALKKTVKAKVAGGQLVISFPHVASGQAIISAIAIASLNNALKPAPSPDPILKMTGVAEKNWPVQDWLDLGDEQFIDTKAAIRSVPPELFGAQWLKGAASGSVKMPAIEITRDADIFVALDSLVRVPAWLNDFTNTNNFIENDGGRIYRVYKKRFLKGAGLPFNGVTFSSGQSLIMAQPASNIEPSYDLKTIASYKAINARWEGSGMVKGQVDGKDRIIFRNASRENILEWNFSVGVGDRYSLTVSYNNPKTETMNGKLQLLSADGTLMKEEVVVFTPTRQGKSNYISTDTGTMINAGNYKLRLTSAEAEGLSINSLDVQ